MFLATTDTVRVITGAAVSSIVVHGSWVDVSGTTYTPGRNNPAAITTATTTTIVASPGAGFRRVNEIVVRNTSATLCDVTLQHYDGSVAAQLIKAALLPGESVVLDETGTVRHLTIFGAEYECGPRRTNQLAATGILAETMPRYLIDEANNSSILSTAIALLNLIYLNKGQVISNISFCSGTTAIGTPTNQIFGLYSKAGMLLRQSNNDTTAAWAADTIKTLALSSSYTVPFSDWYYVACMVTATTPPTLKGHSVRSTSGMVSGTFQLNYQSSGGHSTALPAYATPNLGAPGTNRSAWAGVS